MIISKEMKYSKEFKLDALNLHQEGRSVSGISESLGIIVNTLCSGVEVANYRKIKRSKVLRYSVA